MSEIQATMGAHGMTIDDRHTMLLADCMTYKAGVGVCVCGGCFSFAPWWGSSSGLEAGQLP
jgi:hypothetical protein